MKRMEMKKMQVQTQKRLPHKISRPRGFLQLFQVQDQLDKNTSSKNRHAAHQGLHFVRGLPLERGQKRIRSLSGRPSV